MAEVERYALVKDGKTINVIAWDGVSPYTPPAGCVVVPAEQAPPMPEPEPEE